MQDTSHFCLLLKYIKIALVAFLKFKGLRGIFVSNPRFSFPPALEYAQ